MKKRRGGESGCGSSNPHGPGIFRSRAVRWANAYWPGGNDRPERWG